ncbi:hypothetical protein [Rathayibacter soli]|uniref:hypothetical protein n=1 Tax=Rathayibacter soli TaxID=3144168 RepID=UPI0027E4C8C9|nr:hypothetical protein [Glaciibacter superstes]
MNRINGHPRMALTTAALTTIGLLGTMGLVGCSTTDAAPASAAPPAAVSMVDMSSQHSTTAMSTQVGLYTAMAHLWAQHMEWTNATVVAFAEGSSALTPTLSRLLQNQTDIGNAIKPFYGDAAGDQLTTLLKEHINDAVPVLTAAKAGDTAALNTAVDAWYGNAKAIGDFLAAANPNWKTADMEEMMHVHITQTIAYATDALGGDYAKEIVDYGTAEQHMQEMSDMLSAGIIQQFPKQFK